MSKKDILAYLLENNLSISTMQITISVLIAFSLGLFIYFVYRITYRGSAYSKNFAQSLVLLAIITTIIMATIQSNLALSLGMVGSLSIIRFRTAIKEPRDIVFIFWSVAVGVSCGAAIFWPGIIGSAAFAAAAFIFSTGLYEKTTYLLIVELDGEDGETSVREEIRKHTKKYTAKMFNVTDSKYEYSYEISLSSKDDLTIVNDVKKLKGVIKVNLLSYNGDCM